MIVRGKIAMMKRINMDEKYKQLKAKTEIELGELAIINN